MAAVSSMEEKRAEAGSRTYVLDTNVLLYEPMDLNDTGRNARTVCRSLDKMPIKADSPIAGHITLRKRERSELAELAATLL